MALRTSGPFFPGIGKIPYNPNAKASELAFKHYDPQRVIMGKTMEEHLRFAVCYWHTFRGAGADPFGPGTIVRDWDDGTDSVENALRRLHVAFEFFDKLGVKYWTFHDRDIAPEGKTIEESNRNLDIIVAEAEKLQKKYGIKLLWGTANLFSHPRYMSGGMTSPDAHVFAHAASAVKKAMECTQKLGGENYVFWGGREGYATLLNSDVKRELDHMAAFFWMAINHAKKIGFKGQFLIEPKPKEPSGHQYDYDSQTVIGFLKTYGLDGHIKLNVEPNHGQLAGHRFAHEVHMAAKLGFLGSVDCNTGSEDLGWDTDEFIMNIDHATEIMLAVLQMGGLGKGGMNFDCKVRRESNHVEDMFWAHVGGMDTLAIGLKAAAKIIEDGTIAGMIKQRYSSWDTGIGAQVEKGSTTFDDMHAYIVKHGDKLPASSQEEKYKVVWQGLVSKL